MDAFMMDMGAGAVMRTMAEGLNFGVGLQHITITQDGDHLKLAYTGGREFEQNLLVGGGMQDSSTAAGPARITPSWVDGALRLNICAADGQEQCSRWIYVEDGCLLMQSTTVKGNSIKQVFQQVEGTGTM